MPRFGMLERGTESSKGTAGIDIGQHGDTVTVEALRMIAHQH